ncbi:MAG: EVE domain-containing protein [Gemmatimonadaceae bacterium]|nr:EVE domain-containing protein [Gemmatimonadaceae bacterium]
MAKPRKTSRSAPAKPAAARAKTTKSAPQKAPTAALPPRRAGEVRYWLMKSEPDVFSFDDLWAAPHRTSGWDGVRNFQARNYMRDAMAVGDGVLFYHSNAEPPHIAGIAEVASLAYPDPTQFDAASEYFEPRATPDAPVWMQVDVRAVARFTSPVTLPMLKTSKGLEGLELLRKGSRLSVQVVSPLHWSRITKLGGL